MPVRIYDISKKLGLENKEVLAKAKELGISAAKVPSSSLDKITAEYLETELNKGRVVAAPAPPPPVVTEHKINIVTAPPPPPKPEVPAEMSPPPVIAESPTAPVPEMEEAEQPKENGEAVTAAMPEPPEAIAPPPPKPVAPPPPPPPSGPQLGEKVGFIQLPSKPAPKAGDKIGSVKLPPSRSGGPPQQGGRQDFGRGRPGDNRNFRGGIPPTQGRPQAPGAFNKAGAPPSKPAAPAAPKVVVPESAQVISIKP
ncbi:MAG TPA: translation initiation factor IF-2 N-terminal domain-containing protein, partial [Verrucomicrobiae bacterium]|nr:translation initiation factor IF-2 N-terminal domain-containing protein [Verrucomicrobiae bacterium]